MNLKYYNDKIKDLHRDGKLDITDMGELDGRRGILTDNYPKGKITKGQYGKLAEDTSLKYREIFKNSLYSLDKITLSERETKLIELRDNVEDSFATGKINELQYKLLIIKLQTMKKSKHSLLSLYHCKDYYLKPSFGVVN